MFATELQFYPTTQETADIIYREARIDDKMNVLDPTAGNGVLLDTVQKYKSGYQQVSTYAIEIDQELRFILQGKKHKVIGTDFMQYSEPMRFHRIIMNPPFNKGVQMVLRAWEFLANGGRLVSLLNAETINNPFSDERKALINLINQYGKDKDIGQAFLHAARKTDVDVFIITLEKPKTEESFTFSNCNFSHDEVSAEDFKVNPLAHTGAIQNLVAKYKACEYALKQRYLEQSKLNFYLKDISESVYVSTENRRDGINICNKEEFTDQISELKSRFWNTVFNKTDLSNKATSSFREKFSEFAASQRTMEFNEQNIIEMLSMFFLNREQIMNDCIVDVFDKATGFHEKNCIHKEGWKTNKSYKLSKRIIHPNCVKLDWSGKRLEINGYRNNFMKDIDKVLCWLSNTDPDDPAFVGTHDAIARFCDTTRDTTQWFESTFFRMRAYKKGTVWFDFKDLYLLQDFNLAAAQGKKWIGADY